MNLLNVNVDSVSTGVGAGLATVTVSHTTSGSNRLMLVAIAFDPHGDSVTSVTYGGAALTFVGMREMPSGDHSHVELWSMLAPAVGTADVVVAMTGTSRNGVVVGVTTFTNVDQTTPYENFSSDWGDSTAAAVTVASQAGDLVFAFVHNHNGASASARREPDRILGLGRRIFE